MNGDLPVICYINVFHIHSYTKMYFKLKLIIQKNSMIVITAHGERCKNQFSNSKFLPYIHSSVHIVNFGLGAFTDVEVKWHFHLFGNPRKCRYSKKIFCMLTLLESMETQFLQTFNKSTYLTLSFTVLQKKQIVKFGQ